MNSKQREIIIDAYRDQLNYGCSGDFVNSHNRLRSMILELSQTDEKLKDRIDSEDDYFESNEP